MIRVLIADDHPIVRQGLRRILEEHLDLKVTREARNTQEAIDLASKGDCDVVVLDIDMAGRSGLDALKTLKERKPRLPVLILSVHPEDQFALRVLKAGASGYLTKESAPEDLVKAIRRAFEGKRYITSSLSESLTSELSVKVGEVPHTTLSDREFQVLQMIASGKAVSTIAEEMRLSVKTISTYRARILEKMGMKNNAQLTHYTIMNKLIEFLLLLFPFQSTLLYILLTD
jgi:DNA-binding NarL/FixJ family response regulator